MWWSGEGDVTWGMLRKVGGLQLNRDVRTALIITSSSTIIWSRLSDLPASPLLEDCTVGVPVDTVKMRAEGVPGAGSSLRGATAPATAAVQHLLPSHFDDPSPMRPGQTMPGARSRGLHVSSFEVKRRRVD